MIRLSAADSRLPALGFGLSILAALFTAVVTAQQPRQNPPQRPPIFRAGANLVTVDVYPQRDGTVVAGLTKDDFEVLEDGTPQSVESVEFVQPLQGLSEVERRDPNTQEEGNALAADPRNRVFVVFLDYYHVTIEGSRRTRGPLVDLLNRVVGPTDLFGVTTPLQRPRDLILGRRVGDIGGQLGSFWPWGERDSIRRDAEEDLMAGCYAVDPSNPNATEWIVDDDGAGRPLLDVLIDRRREDLDAHGPRGARRVSGSAAGRAHGVDPFHDRVGRVPAERLAAERGEQVPGGPHGEGPARTDHAGRQQSDHE